MTGKLLVAIMGLLLIIPNNGNPLLKKDKSNEKETENKEDSTKTGTTSTEKPTTVTSKSNDTSQSTTSKSNEQTNETQTKQIAPTTTPEPGAEQDEELLYFMFPKRQKSNQMANFNLQQPFYFVPKGFQPQLMQPQFMFNQQQMQMPYSYPMLFHPPTNPMHSMNTNYYMGSHLPLGTFDGSNKFFVQQSYRQPFDININDRNNKHLTWSISPV